MIKFIYLLIFCYLGCLPLSYSEEGVCPSDGVSCTRKFSLTDNEPEHTNEYYMDKSVAWIKQHIDTDITHMEPILKEAQRQAIQLGLTVPAMFYIDIEDMVRAKWGRVLCALEILTPKGDMFNWASTAKEVFGTRHMLDRVRQERQALPIIPATGDEDKLFDELIGKQKLTIQLNDFIIDKSIKNGNIYLEKFHIELKDWLEAEYPKLNKELKEIPDAQQRLNNIKVLLEDVKLVTAPTF